MVYKALLWKLWRVQRRKYIRNVILILPPAILILFLFLIKSQTSSSSTQVPQTIYSVKTKQDILEIGPWGTVLYCPYESTDSASVDNFIQYVKAIIGQNFEFSRVENETAMVSYFRTNKTSSSGNFGIVFNELNSQNLSYTIRSASSETWYTADLFPSTTTPGPMGNSMQYLNRGFLTLQVAVNEAFATFIGVSSTNWTMQAFPYPSYYSADYYDEISQVMFPVLAYYSFFFQMCCLLSDVIEEKSSGLKELLKINGVKVWMIYSSWFVTFIILCGVSAVLGVVVLKIPTAYGAILEYTNPFLVWLFFLFFCVTGIFLVFFVSLFFNDVKFALFGLILFWIVCYAVSTSNLFTTKSDVLIFLSTFLPVGANNEGICAVLAFEDSQEGINFSNLFTEPPSDSCTFSLGVVMIGMMISWIIYGVLIWYLDKVKPGKLGVASPWHFIFPNAIKCTKWVADDSTEENFYVVTTDRNSSTIVEPVNHETPVGISINSLVKKYGTLTAIDGLTIDIYRNQITALLGHNGAGKSTLVGIISGMFSCTSGSVTADGREITTDIENFRRNIGLCMQENVLLASMSVYEHVVFFGMAKGLSMPHAQDQCTKLLARFNLTEKKNELIMKLSGGMKRKLCLAIALVSDPKILLLDEPTSGLDPESRREIWDILTGYRGNRTILISTHFMEEADYLGDRIAIMSHGRLKCYGTSMFLKKRYGAGYRLTIANCPERMAAQIDSIVLGTVPNSSRLPKTGALTFQLPSCEVDGFPRLFHEVERIIQRSGDHAVALGLTCTNVDDVFLKIQKDEGIKTNVDEFDMPVINSKSQNLSCGMLFLQQCFALTVKKFHWTIRNWMSLLGWLVLIPILMTYLTLSSSEALFGEDDPSLELDLSIYGQTSSILKGNSSDGLYEYYKNSIESEGSSVTVLNSSETIISALLETAEENLGVYRTKMVVSGDFSGVPNALYSTIAYHSAPIAVDLITNAIINNGSNDNLRTITTYNYPINLQSSLCDGTQQLQLSIVWIMTFSMGMLFSLVYFVSFPHMERVTNVRHLQFMTGLSPITYWLASFLFDLVLFAVVVIIAIIVVLVYPGLSGLFNAAEFFRELVVVLFLFGCGAISAAYLASFFFNKHNNAMMMYFFMSIVIAVISWVVRIWEQSEWLVYVCYLFPSAPLTGAMNTIVTNAVNVFAQKYCGDTSLETSSLSSIKRELAYLAGDCLLYFILILLFEYKIFAFISSRIMGAAYGPILDQSNDQTDQDIQREKMKAHEAMRGEGNSFFVSHGLGKKYSRKVTAVYDINFTVDKRSCFGLLGVNGSGKSTTFNMLAGMIQPTKGNAKIGRYSLVGNRSNFLQNLGYCPQLRGLIEDLSARQLLNLFARLRGVHPSQVQAITDKWIIALDMTEVCDRPCKIYSGGNKRKLSTAMSIIGQPAVMLLDEPTTGVDPVIRRKLWDILRQCQQNDQTLIITSHSMDECEAVCDKLTIMVQGRMQCLGPIQLLKNKYAKGHTLVVKIKLNCVTSFYNAIKNKIRDTFPCELKEEQTGILHYDIVNTIPYSQLFAAMNEIKLRHPEIEDFSLSDNSLEQVFLSFARYEQN